MNTNTFTYCESCNEEFEISDSLSSCPVCSKTVCEDCIVRCEYCGHKGCKQCMHMYFDEWFCGEECVHLQYIRLDNDNIYLRTAIKDTIKDIKQSRDANSNPLHIIGLVDGRLRTALNMCKDGNEKG